MLLRRLANGLLHGRLADGQLRWPLHHWWLADRILRLSLLRRRLHRRDSHHRSNRCLSDGPCTNTGRMSAVPVAEGHDRHGWCALQCGLRVSTASSNCRAIDSSLHAARWRRDAATRGPPALFLRLCEAAARCPAISVAASGEGGGIAFCIVAIVAGPAKATKERSAACAAMGRLAPVVTALATALGGAVCAAAAAAHRHWREPTVHDLLASGDAIRGIILTACGHLSRSARQRLPSSAGVAAGAPTLERVPPSRACRSRLRASRASGATSAAEAHEREADDEHERRTATRR